MIYLDHNATNLCDPRVREAYLRGLDEGWANPSSQHAEGRRARAMLEGAREQTAALFGVTPGQVTFTASGTEALNQALFSVTRARGAEEAEPVRIAASRVEHPAVLNALERLVERGLARSVGVGVDEQGVLDLGALERVLDEELCALFALTAAQNEVGTLQPIDEAGALCDARGVPLLLDASQAMGRVERDWSETPWDYLVLSAHKMRAPRGAAALIHRGRAPEPRPLILGGSQERGRRAGTEDTAAIVALGAACELVARGELVDPDALCELRDAFEEQLMAALPGARIVSREVPRLPQTTLLLVPGGDGEALLAGLDLEGVRASTGSACSSGARTPSAALKAIGVSDDDAKGRLRFSFGPETSAEELTRAVELLQRLARAE